MLDRFNVKSIGVYNSSEKNPLSLIVSKTKTKTVCTECSDCRKCWEDQTDANPRSCWHRVVEGLYKLTLFLPFFTRL